MVIVHLHDLLDPVHIDRDTDENVGLAWVSTAPHGNDHALEHPAVAVRTGQRATVVPLQTHVETHFGIITLCFLEPSCPPNLIFGMFQTIVISVM